MRSHLFCVEVTSEGSRAVPNSVIVFHYKGEAGEEGIKGHGKGENLLP